MFMWSAAVPQSYFLLENFVRVVVDLALPLCWDATSGRSTSSSSLQAVLTLPYHAMAFNQTLHLKLSYLWCRPSEVQANRRVQRVVDQLAKLRSF
jgi:hypothetical protein